MCQDIFFSGVFTKYIELVHSELRHLYIEFDEMLKITTLNKLLRENNTTVKKQKLAIKFSKTARDEDLESLHFKPMHCPAVQWGYVYI